MKPSAVFADSARPHPAVIGLPSAPRADAVQRHGEHEVLFLQGDPADRLYELVEGAVMLYKILPDGRRQVVELLGPGDLFGMAADDTHDCAAETLTTATIRAHDRAAIERSPEQMRRLGRRLHAQICALHEHTVLLGRMSALERVASFIMRHVPGHGGPACAGRRRAAEQPVIHLSMTRQEIADYLGLTLETVSRTFSELRRRGVITVEKQDRIRITDVCGTCSLTGAA